MQTLKEKMTLLGRLQKRPEFLRVAKEGRHWVSKGITLQAAPNEMEHPRFGLTITKKIYKQAVKRNRIRRRMRSVAYEVLSQHAQDGYDFVLIGKTETLDRPYPNLVKDLKWCLKKLELLK